uniref:uncharacterized protein LOC122588124 n=1 Tax=Erigeron canadensis TaxID=72917 RepID=UPI001CB91180|nr:uncharacterized protein LOC122588124 [Erigeron canadensis]
MAAALCKQWCSKYINDPYNLATIDHTIRAAVEEPVFIMFHLLNNGDQYSNNLCTLSFSDSTISDNSTSIKVSRNRKIMEFECKRKRTSSFFANNDIILGSCNELLYASRQHVHENRAKFSLVVIHPLRKECYELPPNDIWLYKSGIIEQESCGLGFDDYTNTYKMVCVVLQGYVSCSEFYNVSENLCTMVHVLGTDDSWRRISQVPCYPVRGEGIFANGCLHWLVSCLDYSPNNELGRKVIFFDIRIEEFGLIGAPRRTCYNWVDEHLVDLNDRVGFVYHDFAEEKIGVLVLNKEKDEWEMYCCFDKRPPLIYNRFIKVLGFWNKSGDIVMTNHDRNRLFVYGVKDESLYEVGVYDDEFDQDIRMYRPSE